MPVREVYEKPIQTDYNNKGFGNTASDAPLAFHATTIAGTPLTFTYIPLLSLRGAFPLCHCEEPQATKQTMARATPKTLSLRGAAGDHDAVPAHSGLQATYFPSGNNTQPTPITQYPLIPTTNGTPKSFSQLTAAEAMLLAREGKWEVSSEGALRYLGMRGRGGMQASKVIEQVEISLPTYVGGTQVAHVYCSPQGKVITGHQEHLNRSRMNKSVLVEITKYERGEIINFPVLKQEGYQLQEELSAVQSEDSDRLLIKISIPEHDRTFAPRKNK